MQEHPEVRNYDDLCLLLNPKIKKKGGDVKAIRVSKYFRDRANQPPNRLFLRDYHSPTNRCQQLLLLSVVNGKKKPYACHTPAEKSP